MNVFPIGRVSPGEQALATVPTISPATEAGWRRRLNLFTGRALSDTALTAEQEYRGGHLATLGQTLSHGVISGLEVDREVGGTSGNPQYFLHVGPGQGLTAAGEDVIVPQALRVPLNHLFAYRTLGPATQPLPPPVSDGPQEMVPAGAATGPTLGPLYPSPLPQPQFEGPWEEVRPGGPRSMVWPRVMVLVLEPVSAELAGSGPPATDTCAQDPADDAFADWQRADGCRLALYAWPWSGSDFSPNPQLTAWRNQVAATLFRIEAGYGPGEVHPWEENGVALALLGFDASFRLQWIDTNAVVRAGGNPRGRHVRVAGAGSEHLWQARLQQFAEEANGYDWKTPGVGSRFRHLPPMGLLPRAAALELENNRIFPSAWAVDAVPVPVDQLDAVARMSAGLAPYDLALAFDRVRVLVPVPQDVYDPRLLLDEVVSPEFQEAIDLFSERRLEFLYRREDLRRKVEAIVEGFSGTRPQLPRPEDDPERLEDEPALLPTPRFGTRAHRSPLRPPGQENHEHHFSGLPLVLPVDPGDRLFAWVYLNPAEMPRELILRWWSPEGWEYRAYWGENLVPLRTWGVADSVRMGDLPPAGEWVRLEVMAHRAGLEERHLHGMSFGVFGGSAIWDRAGRIPSTDAEWFNDSTPPGVTFPDGTWDLVPTWASAADPLPLSAVGLQALHVASSLNNPVAQRSFVNAAEPMTVREGDVLFAYIRRDATNPAAAVMLQWNDGSWDHRAAWGPDIINLGVGGTASRFNAGALPPANTWARVEVPAAKVGLEGSTVRGFAFTVTGGGAVVTRVGVRRARDVPAGTGLTAEYYSDANLTQLTRVRVETTDLTLDAAGTGNTRAIRWSGQFVPQFTEPYTLTVLASTGVRLWVNGQQLLNATVSTSAFRQFNTVPVSLVAGRRHDIVLEVVRFASDPIVVSLRWSSANQRIQPLPRRMLYPSRTAGGIDLLPRAEEPWVDDDVPAGAVIDNNGFITSGINEGWSWYSPPVYVPPEGDYGTDLAEGARTAIPLRQLRTFLSTQTPLRDDERVELDRRGLERFIGWLDAKVRRCDDVVNFGFVRVQADIYRLRQLMLGETAATRLATSPALASIIQSESALQVREGLLDFLKASTITSTSPNRDASVAGDTADALSAGAEEESEPVSALPLSSRAFLSSAGAFEKAAAVAPVKASFVSPLAGVISKPVAVASPVAPRAAALAATAAAVTGAFQAGGSTPIVPRKPAATAEVLLKQPIVGETYDFRTVTVGERLETPAANEAKSFTTLTRFEVLQSLLALDINLDDLWLPGFIRMADNLPVYRTGFSIGGKPVRIPVREPRQLSAIRPVVEEVTLREPDPDDADEPRFFSVGVELLDATIAALRAVEGRVQQYRDALDRCRQTLQDLYTLARALDARMATVEDELAEARHDVSVARALLAEETRRVDAVNTHRREVLDRFVPFLAWQRPRVIDALKTAPSRPLDPAFTGDPVPACLAQPVDAPRELRAVIALLREAPVRWFLALPRLLDGLDRPELLIGTLQQARVRAMVQDAPGSLEYLGGGVGKLGEAIGRRFVAQQAVVAETRGIVASVDMAKVQGQGWMWLRDQAESILSPGDLIDAGHGRTDVGRGAAKELDDILRVATCLYERFGQVPALIRLEWADRLSQFDQAADLRNLYSLPAWPTLEYLDRREMQALVDWLFQRMDPRRPEAVALMNDVVRVCILLASHAPVNQLLSGKVTRLSEVRVGAVLPLDVDPVRVRVGMHVLAYDDLKRPIRAVIEDLANDVVVSRVVQAPAGTVTLPVGARVQVGPPERLEVTAEVPKVMDRKTQVLDDFNGRLESLRPLQDSVRR